MCARRQFLPVCDVVQLGRNLAEMRRNLAA